MYVLIINGVRFQIAFSKLFEMTHDHALQITEPSVTVCTSSLAATTFTLQYGTSNLEHMAGGSLHVAI